jgi:hypothetical protein
MKLSYNASEFLQFSYFFKKNSTYANQNLQTGHILKNYENNTLLISGRTVRILIKPLNQMVCGAISVFFSNEPSLHVKALFDSSQFLVNWFLETEGFSNKFFFQFLEFRF